MEAFIDRHLELDFPRRIQASAGFILLYGRQRISKTLLLRH